VQKQVMGIKTRVKVEVKEKGLVGWDNEARETQ
jgi:hypothetical protein